MNVNRGGRRGIEVESANRCISLALWPRILHRASSIKYFAGTNKSSSRDPTDTSPRATVVFSLLRDHANIFEHLLGKTEKDVAPQVLQCRRHQSWSKMNGNQVLWTEKYMTR
mmetsp:Transcript_3789/g.8679  ORF Transcript_3789/g.8679 Transcript_3789/m.8679 type:complete len:112 (+) Transcript_3789:1-336(+)